MFADKQKMMNVHQRLMRALPVRTVRCEDDVEFWELPKVSPPRPRRSRARKRAPGYVSPIEKFKAMEKALLDQMEPDHAYSTKHLAAMGGMVEKVFYTHIRRMVERKQLIRTGRRRYFRYKKNEADG